MKILTGRRLYWHSTVCTCSAFICVDQPDLARLFLEPCDAEHLVWVVLVGRDVLDQKLREMKPYPPRYKKTLDNYLKWCGDSNFLRPSAVPAGSTLSAAQAMRDSETYGVCPQQCVEPELLARYLQGKACREFHITEWKAPSIRMGNWGEETALFYPEEFLGTLGMDRETFKFVWGREPNDALIAYLDRPLTN